MKFLIFMTLLSVMGIKSAYSVSIGNSLLNPLDRLTSDDDSLLPHGRKFHQPELIGISVKKLKNDDDELNPEGRQIPVISDIERIKKVIEIIAFVGEKVGEIVDKIDVPSHQADYEATENPQATETQ